MSQSKFNSRVLVSAARRLYLDAETADVHFIFESYGQSERVPAHKTLLIAVSKVFRVMFNGQWEEKDEVPIPDVFAADFKTFLQYFYFDVVELSMDNVDGVMNLGNQYDVVACFNDCVTLLGYNLTAENACCIYGLAMFFAQEDLKSECETFIALNTKDVLKSTSFLECDQKMLGYILKLDSMSCSEADVFNSCMAWVKNASKQDDLNKELVENHLGNLFNDIRFRSMTIEEFNAIYTAHGYLFSMDEAERIKKMIKPEKQQWNSYNGVCRSNPWDNFLITLECNRVKYGTDIPIYEIRYVETTTFSINITLLLKGIVFAEMSNEYTSDAIKSKLTVIEINPLNSNEVKSRVIFIDSNVEIEFYEKNVILLPKPLVIRRDFKYKIRLNLDLTDFDFRGNRVSTSMVFSDNELEIKPGITVKFYEVPVLHGENRGMIEGLKFIEI